MGDTWSWWLAGIVVLFAAFCGIIALWAARGRAYWFWRYLALVTPIALLAAVPAPDPVIVYLGEAVTIVTTVWIAAVGWLLLRRCREALGVPVTQVRFAIRDALLAVALLGVSLASFRAILPRLEFVFLQLCIVGASFGTVVLVAYWAMRGTKWPWFRWTLVPLCSITLARIWGAAGISLSDHRFWLYREGRLGPFDFRDAFLLWLIANAIMGWIALAIPAGVLLPVPKQFAARRASWLRLASWALAAGYSTPIAAMYVVLIWPVPVPRASLPDPNGYLEVVKAARRIDWLILAPAHEMADDATLRSFSEKNADAFERVSATLQRPSLVPGIFDYPQTNSRYTDLTTLRDLGQALSLDAKATAARGQSDRALRRSLDQLRLSEVIARGGLNGDCFSGMSVLEQGIADLRTAMAYLDAQQCRHAASSLQNLEAGWEPMEVLMAREQAHWWNASGWTGRVFATLAWLNRDPPPWSSSSGHLEEKREGLRALLRLMQTTLALRGFHLERGSQPASLTELVPRYLASVPLDPYDDRPLRYKRTATGGFRLYSIGANLMDDGGKLVSSSDASFNGDLFLEAWDVDAPEAAAAASNED